MIILRYVLKAWLFLSLLGVQPIEAADWHHVKDVHFIVFYDNEKDAKKAQEVLRKAEYYYKKIARQIGYSRYSNFWTWDERVRIFMFSRKEDYLHRTGQPLWSRGYAFSHEDLFRQRLIVTFKQEENFLDGLLPHEISHLILLDFIGFDKRVPMWFDEGVAQLQEAKKRHRAHRIMKEAIAKAEYIPISIIHKVDIRQEKDNKKVTIFYSQSLSLVDFLIKKYGSRALGNLCREIRKGKSFEKALRSAYSQSIQSLSELEEKWLRYMRRD